jgi:hypothetical protein
MVGDVVSVQQRDREVEREVFREVSREQAADTPAPPHIVKDASGIRWRVTEVHGHQVPGARGEACLVFECDTAIRRVWDYPACWRELPPPDLIQVSWGR